jgi:hypothetical protein
MKYYLFGIYILLVTCCTTHVNTANSKAKKVAAPKKFKFASLVTVSMEHMAKRACRHLLAVLMMI